MPRQKKPLLLSLDSVVADGVGTVINVGEYRNIGIQLSLEDSPDMKIQAMASNSEEEPNFANPQSKTNHYDFAQMIDLESGDAIDGDTGISPGGVAEHRNLTINADNFRWICFKVSSWVAGDVSVGVRPVDNS